MQSCSSNQDTFETDANTSEMNFVRLCLLLTVVRLRKARSDSSLLTHPNGTPSMFTEPST